jgi:hypothetical protein
VDSVNSSSDYFAYLCISLQVKPCFIRKKASCGSISLLTTDCRNQLQNCTLLAGLHGCKAWISVVLWGLSFSNCVALLALDFDTPFSSARHFSDF